MGSKLQILVVPVVIILVLFSMYSGYRYTIGFHGPNDCLSALEEENPVAIGDWAKVATLNTRLMDDHWIAAILLRNGELEEYEEDYEVTYVCHFDGTSYSYKWSQKYLGDELNNIEFNSISIVNPKTW